MCKHCKNVIADTKVSAQLNVMIAYTCNILKLSKKGMQIGSVRRDAAHDAMHAHAHNTHAHTQLGSHTHTCTRAHTHNLARACKLTLARIRIHIHVYNMQTTLLNGT